MKQTYTIRLDIELHDAIKEEAKHRRIPISDVITSALLDYFYRKERAEKWSSQIKEPSSFPC